MKLVKNLKMIIQKVDILQVHTVMVESHLDRYIASVQSDTSSTPAMIDELSIFLMLSRITGEHIISYEDLIEANIPYIFVYDIPEDKKEFNIETVRKCIIDIGLLPYSWKNIYILRHFDTATLSAQNALLKVLEECPQHAVILLELANPNSILDTVRSRVVDLTSIGKSDTISTIGQEIVNFYRAKNYQKLASTLYTMKCTSEEAILILRWVYPYLSDGDMERCDSAIESLASTHENPKSILDIFFL